jgi:hypothetical protein
MVSTCRTILRVASLRPALGRCNFIDIATASPSLHKSPSITDVKGAATTGLTGSGGSQSTASSSSLVLGAVNKHSPLLVSLSAYRTGLNVTPSTSAGSSPHAALGSTVSTPGSSYAHTLGGGGGTGAVYILLRITVDTVFYGYHMHRRLYKSMSSNVYSCYWKANPASKRALCQMHVLRSCYV